MGKVGRKGKYEEWLTDDGLFKIAGWAKRGLTDAQIAHNMGIGRQTLYEWIKKYPDIKDTLKRGKEVVDINVENALVKNALGYDVEETKVVVDKDGKPVRIEKTKKHIRPDTTAQMFYLQNRLPDTLNNVQRFEHSVKLELMVEQVDETTKDLSQTEEGKKLLRQLFELKSKEGMG